MDKREHSQGLALLRLHLPTLLGVFLGKNLHFASLSFSSGMRGDSGFSAPPFPLDTRLPLTGVDYGLTGSWKGTVHASLLAATPTQDMGTPRA